MTHAADDELFAGRVIADLVSGRAPAVDLTSFSPGASREHLICHHPYVVVPRLFVTAPKLCSAFGGDCRVEEDDVSEFEMTARTRREVLGLLGGLGAAVVLAGCGSSGGSSAAKSTSGKASATTTTTPATTTTTATATVASCSVIPEETAGPYPGDGTNGPNVLTESGVVRSDIRSSFGSASGVASGVPLTINLTVVDTKNGCAPVSGAAVYVWHCTQDGQYSMYGQGITGENYLRGVQETDANGQVSFTSIFPAAYSGRWPHIHFEVFPSLAKATNGANKTAVSQLALPADVCNAVYATDGYSQSVRNLAQTSLQTDMVFSDGVSLQTPTVTGTTSGYTAKNLVGV